jgi:hypothetical protein
MRLADFYPKQSMRKRLAPLHVDVPGPGIWVRQLCDRSKVPLRAFATETRPNVLDSTGMVCRLAHHQDFSFQAVYQAVQRCPANLPVKACRVRPGPSVLSGALPTDLSVASGAQLPKKRHHGAPVGKCRLKQVESDKGMNRYQ